MYCIYLFYVLLCSQRGGNMEQSMRYTIYDCMKNLLIREEKDYVTLKEIYTEVASYLEKECTKTFESQIRGRLQEYCPQYEI